MKHILSCYLFIFPFRNIALPKSIASSMFSHRHCSISKFLPINQLSIHLDYKTHVKHAAFVVVRIMMLFSCPKCFSKKRGILWRVRNVSGSYTAQQHLKGPELQKYEGRNETSLMFSRRKRGSDKVILT